MTDDRSIYVTDANGTLCLLEPMPGVWVDDEGFIYSSEPPDASPLYRLTFPPETVAAPPPKG